MRYFFILIGCIISTSLNAQSDDLIFNDDYSKNGDLKANGIEYFLQNVLPTNDTTAIKDAMKSRGYAFNKLLDDPISDDSSPFRSNTSVLLLVVIDKCNINTLKFFLDNGAKPNVRAIHKVYNHFTGALSGTYYSRYPLVAACNLKDTAKMNLLIKYGANIRLVADKLKEISLENLDFDFMEYVRVITGGMYPENILFQIILSYQKEKLTPALIDDLVKKGANINAKDEATATLLMYAIRQKLPLSCIKEIIKQGANVNTGTIGYKQFYNPMIYAVNYNNLDVVKALVEAGADFNVIGENFKGSKGTPLSISTANGFKEIAAYLFSKGAK